MEPKAKKPKIFQLEFVDMNDDCLTFILEKLSVVDLCSMSFVSRNLQWLAYAVFTRKNPQKFLTVDTIWDQSLHQFKIGFAETEEKYLKYFAKAIRKVEMKCSRKSIEHFLMFLKEEGCSNLKSLKIKEAKSNLALIPGKKIKDQLRNMESLSIETFPVKVISKQHENWMVYCHDLKELSIKTTHFGKGEWLLDVYPKLESLALHLLDSKAGHECFFKYAPQFFEKHSNLKEIKCVGFLATQGVLHSLMNIQRFVVKFRTEQLLISKSIVKKAVQ